MSIYLQSESAPCLWPSTRAHVLLQFDSERTWTLEKTRYVGKGDLMECVEIIENQGAAKDSSRLHDFHRCFGLAD
jgi:hypothetical protein